MPRKSYDSLIATQDVPIIPHPDIRRIRADTRRIFEKLAKEQISQPGRKMIPEEK